MVELDSHSSADRSDSGANRNKAEALGPNPPVARTFAPLAATFTIQTVSATWSYLWNTSRSCCAPLCRRSYLIATANLSEITVPLRAFR